MEKSLLMAVLVTLCFPLVANAKCTQAPSGMTAWWRAENNAYDSAGTYDGTMTNGAAFTTGMVGQALTLDGVDDYVDLPDGFADFTSGFTVTLWAYPTAGGYWVRFIDFGNGQGSSNVLFARESTSDNLVFEVYNSSGVSGGKVTAPGAIDNNAWHFYAATEDASGQVTVYKDGQALVTGTTFVPENLTRVNNFIGRSNWSVDGYYSGRIDELTIYDRALSSSEIAAIYNAGSDGICTGRPAPAFNQWGLFILVALLAFAGMAFEVRRGSERA